MPGAMAQVLALAPSGETGVAVGARVAVAAIFGTSFGTSFDATGGGAIVQALSATTQPTNAMRVNMREV